MPAYNASKYIDESIESLIGQSIKLDEILIIDDCSTDNTLEIIRKYANTDKSIKILRQSRNLGVSTARNKGIETAHGEWLLFMDADDIAHPTLVEEEIKYLKKLEKSSPNKWALVHPAYLQINENGESLDRILRGKQYGTGEIFGYELFRNQIVTPSGALINKKALMDVGGFNEKLKYNEDWDLWLRLAKKWGFAYVDKPLVKVRRHPNNTTNEFNKTANAEIDILRKFELTEIKGALFNRRQTKDRNRLDYISMLYRLEKWEEAFEEFSKLDYHSGDSVFFLKSLYYIKKKNYVEAKACLIKALECEPSHGASVNNLGILYIYTGERNKAKELFERALKLFPGYMDAELNLRILMNNEEGNFRFTWRELRKVLLSYSK